MASSSAMTSSPSGSLTFVVDSAIRGYHIYKNIWPSPVAEERLQCEREVGNSHDPMSVAVKKLIDGESTIVGHVPRRISPLCSAFIRKGGSITCIVDGPRRYSADLPQGGLELPCKLMFIAPNLLECKKMEKLVRSSLEMSHLEPQSVSIKYHPAISKSVESSSVTDSAQAKQLQEPITQEYIMAVDNIMCSPPKKRSKSFDEEAILMGNELTDVEINFAQELLKAQFTNIRGLQSTLLQQNISLLSKDSIENRVQILFCKERNHWIMATTISCTQNEVKIYDSLFQYLDRESIQLVETLFHCDGIDPQIKMIQCRKQVGAKDCGVFAIAFATAIAHGLNPSRQKLNQQAMRAHLVNCFNNKFLTPFPCTGK